MQKKYKRILLKVSGEYLGGEKGYGFDASTVNAFAQLICKAHDMGVETGIVVGGGNFFRGARSVNMEMDRVAADQMGMLSTVINALCLREAIEKHGKKCRVMSAVKMESVAETFVKRNAVRCLEEGEIVIFGGGTGNPYFTTDTAAVLRAMEINADVVIKGTMVDGVYDKDPHQFPDAKKWDTLNYDLALEKDLKVMDATAIAFCRDTKLPIIVLDIREESNLIKTLSGEIKGTIVHSGTN